jgi:hypothetical protein
MLHKIGTGFFHNFHKLLSGRGFPVALPFNLFYNFNMAFYVEMPHPGFRAWRHRVIAEKERK